MTENRAYAVWLRSLAGFVALAGVLGLSACGGGSGAPNNVFNTPGPLTVLPGAAVAYSGMPIALTVSGGTPPYRAFSSNPALVPVAQAVAGSTIVLVPGPVANANDVEVTITVQDNPITGGSVPANTAAALTVRAAPLVNSLTITPNLPDCGTTAICSGQSGTATVTVLGPQGGPLAGRLVRFDVIGTTYAIVSGAVTVATLTVASDANGLASVIIKANVNTPTQFAQLRVTDLTSGQQLTGNFLIQQLTDGSKILTVIPAKATITGPSTTACSTGFITEYFIYGGTPPYRVTSTFPTAVTLVNPIVNASGGSFQAITNGTCVDPLTFSIVDATGVQTSLATLSNILGTTAATPAPALALVPGSVAATGCLGKTFAFIASGGTPPYGAIVTPTFPVAVAASTVTVSGLPAGAGSYTVTVFDAGAPQKTATATITCS